VGKTPSPRSPCEVFSIEPDCDFAYIGQAFPADRISFFRGIAPSSSCMAASGIDTPVVVSLMHRVPIEDSGQRNFAKTLSVMFERLLICESSVGACS
jgi:hypothetical protein